MVGRVTPNSEKVLQSRRVQQPGRDHFSTVRSVTVPSRWPRSPRLLRPVTRSLPELTLPGCDGLVHGLVDAEDLRQPGDPEDPQYLLPRADQIQRAVVHPHPPQAPDQHPEAGGVEEPHLVQVDDELVAALADQVDEQLTQPRRRIHIDLAPDVDDLDTVLGVVTQLQIHTSSSAMPGVISTSIPAPRAGVVRARADPLPHSATLHYQV